MATQAIITFGRAGGRSVEGASLPILKLDGTETTEVIAVTSNSQVTSAAASSAPASQLLQDGGFVSVTARGGDVFIATGPSPTAAVPASGATGKGHPVLNGQTQSFAVAPGAKVAVIALPAA